MNKIKFIILIILSGLLLLTSCDDWFDKSPEDGTITGKDNFENSEAFYRALAGVYTKLREVEIYGGTLSVSTLEFMAQNYKPKDEESQAAARFDFQRLEKDEIISELWLKMYSAIAQTNQIIEEIEKTEILFTNKNQKEIITGELYAIRAMVHFDLMRLFHPAYKQQPEYVGIPYMTKFGMNVTTPQSSEQVLVQIIKDLAHAVTLLDQRDPIMFEVTSSSATVGQVDRRLRTFHLNYYAVTAMLARVYLYKGDYSSAFTNADITYNHIRNITIRDQVFYFFNPSNIGSDYSFSREHIFGLASPVEGLTTIAERLFEKEEVLVSDKFLDVYPYVSDTRFRTWFRKQTDNSYIMSAKFSKEALLSGYLGTSGGGEVFLPVRIPIIKLGEVCLIAAESLNEQGDTDAAADWIIKMQTSKDITVVKDMKADLTLTQSLLREEIRNEYERELWGEGQLFYFYKRMNDASIISHDNTSISMNDTKYTIPIPANGL